MEVADLEHITQIKIQHGDALLVVDIQNDFMPGGALPVAQGDSIIAGVNGVMRIFSDLSLPVVLTQDWHPAGHHSFASAHSGKKPFDPYRDAGIGPVLWPDHCVQGTPGADFHSDLDTKVAQVIIRKGYHKTVDSYSGFLENDKLTMTGLDGYLTTRQVKRIFIGGLALDYCVFFTALDGADLGYKVIFLTDLSKPVGSPPDSISRALKTMKAQGVEFAISSAVKR